MHDGYRVVQTVATRLIAFEDLFHEIASLFVGKRLRVCFATEQTIRLKDCSAPANPKLFKPSLKLAGQNAQP